MAGQEFSSIWGGDELVPLDGAGPLIPEHGPRLGDPVSPLEWSVGLAGPVLAWLFLCIVGLRGFVATPVSDTHGWLAQLFLTERDHSWLGYLWRPHNNQRIVFSRLFTWWDIDVLRGSGPSAFVVSGLAIQLAVALAATALTLIALPRSVGRPWFAALVGLVLLNIAIAEDVCLANDGVYVQAAGFAVLAILAFALRGSQGWRRAMTPIALLCAVLAMFGNAAGLAIWPVLMVSALRGQAGRATIVTILAMGALTVGFAQIGVGAPEGSGHGDANPLKMISYFCGYIALPWGVMPNLPVRIIGALLAGLYGLLLWLSPGRDKGVVAPTAGRDLIAFALFTAALAAVGRVNELPQPIVPVRYAPFAMAGQAGLILALAPKLSGWLEARGRAILAVAATLVLVLYLFNEAQGARRVDKTVAIIRAASDAFDRGDRSPPVVANVYPPDPGFASAIRDQLRRRSLPW